MAVKIIIKRNFKSGTLKDAQEMLIRARSNAMKNNGYISSETLSNYDDPNTVYVVSMWETKADWDRYADSEARNDNERHFSEILEGMTEYEVFRLGLGQ